MNATTNRLLRAAGRSSIRNASQPIVAPGSAAANAAKVVAAARTGMEKAAAGRKLIADIQGGSVKPSLIRL